MTDLVVVLRVASGFALRFAIVALDAMGHALATRFAHVEVWAAALLAGALVIDRALARRTQAAWRIALYAPVALRALIPIDWSVQLAGAPRAETIVAPLLVRAQGGGGASHGPSLFAALAAVYLAVAALLALRAVVARARLARSLDDARPIASTGGAPCLVLEHASLGPMVVGLASPRIVLPRRLLAPSARHALACVLRHESAHLRRGDPWLAAAMQIVAIVAWPVVPVWIAIARVRQLVELACDEAALEGAGADERRRYGHALLDLAEWRALAPAGAALHFGSTLRARIEALASQRHWPRAAQAAVIALAPIALLAACGGAAPKPAAPSNDAEGYGYEFDVDSAKSSAGSSPASDHNADGRVAPEAIQASVRSHLSRFTRCYESGLARDPKLAGTVRVRTVFDAAGTTKQAADDHSTLVDRAVVDCVVAEFKTITYPKGPPGDVTVVYPLEFAP